MRLHVEQLECRETPSATGIYAVGAGPGGTPRVQVFDLTTGAKLADFQAYENTFTGGVTTAVIDVNQDNVPDLILGPSTGGGPRVRVVDGRCFRANPTVSPAPRNNTLISGNCMIADFFAYEAEQRGGVYVAGGNILGSSHGDLIVGAGPGGGPRVRIFDGENITKLGRSFNGSPASADFFAFESSFRNGVTVSASPAPTGGLSEFLTVAPGAGGSPRIRVLSGIAIAQQLSSYVATNLTGFPNNVIADFFSGNSNGRQGAFVASADFNRDGAPDVAVGTGIGPLGSVTLYNGQNIRTLGAGFNGLRPNDILDAFLVSGNDYFNGVTVGHTIESADISKALLFYGYGGPNDAGRAVLIRYINTPGALSPQILDDITFDGLPRNVFVSH